MPTARTTRTAAALLGLALVAPVQLASPASAAPLPDLRVRALSAGASSVQQGGQLAVKDTTSNTGKARAGRTQTRFYLSADTRLSTKDRMLGSRKVPALRPGSTSRATTRLTVPETTQARSWHLLACADARKQVREGNEGNNCRAARNPVTVTPDDTTTPTFPLEPDPLTIEEPALETANAVTQWAFSRDSDPATDDPATTIEATADDGTTYTLEIPADALVGSERVTMTPVATDAPAAGFPLSEGIVAGVQLEPHGLLLLRPALLTIDSPDLGSLDAQTPFLFHEGGEDFHLYPADLESVDGDPDTVSLALTHFSTPGVGLGTAAERQGVAAHPTARGSGQVEGTISGLVNQERASQEAGNPPNPAVMQEITQVLNAYYDSVVRPRMVAAETNGDLAAEAIAEGLGWSRQLQLLGDEDNPRHAEIMERVEKILRNVKDEKWADCLDHDLGSISHLLRVARTAALMGYAWEQEALDKAFGCARFEVRFDSLVTSATSWSGNLQTGSSEGRWRTRSTVVTEFLVSNNVGPLTWADFSYTMDNTITDPGSTCRLSETGTGTTPGQLRAQATPLLGTINVIEGAPGPTPVPVSSAVNVVSDAKPAETYQYTSCDGSTSTSTDSRWFGHYESTGKFWTTDPAQQAGDFLDSKTFTIVDDRPGSSTTETTTVEVWHKPQA